MVERIIVLLSGPSSVGKSTLSKKLFKKSCTILDTDVVWTELEKSHTGWWSLSRKAKLNLTLVETISRSTKVSSPVIVHDDPSAFGHLIPEGYSSKTLFVLTSLVNIRRNVVKRQDRIPSSVLGDLKKFITPCSAGTAKSVEIFRKDLDMWRNLNNTKQLANKIGVFERYVFKNDSTSAYVCPTFPVDEVLFIK